MDANEFKKDYYLKRTYEQKSGNKFSCKVVVLDKRSNIEITGIETEFDIKDLGKKIENAQINNYEITLEMCLNQAILMLFNLTMLKMHLSDLYNIVSQKSIADFFDEDPFHNE